MNSAHRQELSALLDREPGLVVSPPAVSGNGHSKLQTQLITKSFASIELRRLSWLWDQRIPKSKLTLFSGPPDTGKTTAACDVIARITTGRDWPDGTPNQNLPMDVLYLSAEDDAEDTIKPRLVAADAELTRVHLVESVRTTQAGKQTERRFMLDSDLAHLERKIVQLGEVGLVVIDPLSSYAGKADISKGQALRRLLEPVKEFCARVGVTAICLGHFNKRTDSTALDRISGPVELAAVARAAWLFVKNPEIDGERLMLLGKGNLTRKRSGLRYRIEEKQIDIAGTPAGVPIIKWLGDSESDADTVLETAANPTEKKRAKAEHFLREFLAVGAQPSEQIEAEGKKQFLGRNSLFDAKKELGIRAFKAGSAWFWELPSVQEFKDSQ